MRSPAVLALVAFLLIPGCVASQASGPRLVPAAEREPAPEVRAQTLDGDDLGLDELSGPVVVNFWASWCGPCVAEAPELRNVYLAYVEDGVSVVGVNVQDRLANARRFEDELDIPFPSWSDPASEIAAAFGGIGPAALPSTLVLDAEQRVAARFFGAVTFTELKAVLDPLLEERDGAGTR